MYTKGAAYYLIFFLIFLALPHDSLELLCYPDVGCFEIEDWYFPGVLPPQHPSMVSTFMYYYNRNLPSGIIYNIYPSIQIDGIPYNQFKDTVLICHGYTDNSETKNVLLLKDALLSRLDVNILIIDYSAGSSGLYENTLGNAPLVARLFAKVVLKIGIPPSQIHIIGHSIGAHIAGQIGNVIEKETGEKVYRITGLDPAGPKLNKAGTKFRLDPSDANYVDVLHTNSAGYGTSRRLGHIDFYINGGAVQPGCFAEKVLTHMDFKTFCAHQRAFEYYIETLYLTNCMKGKPVTALNYLAANTNAITVGAFANSLSLTQGTCADNQCVPVGLDAIESPLKGAFVVITNRAPPFCIPLT